MTSRRSALAVAAPVTVAITIAVAGALLAAAVATACRCAVVASRSQVEQALVTHPVVLPGGRRVSLLRSACTGEGKPVVARTPAGRQELYRFFACTLTPRAAGPAAVEVMVTGFDAKHELPLLYLDPASAVRAA